MTGGFMRHFAVVGSGPAGFYTAEALEKAYGDGARIDILRSEEHTSELQSQSNLVCRLLLEKKKTRLRSTAPFPASRPRAARHSRVTPVAARTSTRLTSSHRYIIYAVFFHHINQLVDTYQA